MDMSVNWPGGARCAVMISFDFDAESNWIASDPNNAKRLGTLSQGTYGANVGVPKIIELLDQIGIKSTFFVPGWVAEKHTDRVELILKHGHEIGHHGYLHELIDGADPARTDKEEEWLVKGLESLKRTVGVVPIGYRSPSWEASESTIPLLARYGLEYDSSLMDHVMPYRHKLPDGSKGPIELPVHWSLDDAPFMAFARSLPWHITSPEQVTKVWSAEFQEIYRWGGLFNLTMHPQFSGRPSRIATLREFLRWIEAFPDVWFATASEIARAWAQTSE
jgi:peptidoglycan/xylan/chitin deacetylase (PgdA/CDA1 family)